MQSRRHTHTHIPLHKQKWSEIYPRKCLVFVSVVYLIPDLQVKKKHLQTSVNNGENLCLRYTESMCVCACMCVSVTGCAWGQRRARVLICIIQCVTQSFRHLTDYALCNLPDKAVKCVCVCVCARVPLLVQFWKAPLSMQTDAVLWVWQVNNGVDETLWKRDREKDAWYNDKVESDGARTMKGKWQSENGTKVLTSFVKSGYG